MSGTVRLVKSRTGIARPVEDWIGRAGKAGCGETERGRARTGAERQVSMIYEWKAGSRHKVSAQVAGEVCDELEQHGLLTAKHLVDVSRPEEAPLHQEFVWNDAEAAELFREHQARCLIAHIVVREIEDSVPPSRAYYNIVTTEPKYESIHTILSNPDKRRQLLKKAMQELRSFRRKYADIEQLAQVFQAIDAVEEET